MKKIIILILIFAFAISAGIFVASKYNGFNISSFKKPDLQAGVEDSNLCAKDISIAQISKTVDGKNYLSDCNGFSLYISDNDSESVISCLDSCEKIWIPYLIPEGKVALTKSEDEFMKKFNVVTRPDGSLQYAIGTKPLYKYINDTQAEIISGEGVDGTWHVATP